MKASRDILVIDFLNQIKFNPLLPPPGVSVKYWIDCFADIFIQAFSLFDGTKNYLIETLNYLFTRNNMPTIHDLYRLVKSHSFPVYSRFARYQESALNRLGGLKSSLGDIFTYPCISLEEIVKRHVIFEIQMLTSEQQIFVVNILLTWLFIYKLYNYFDRYSIVGVDDANLLFDRSFEHRPDHGLPIISHLVATIRKFKIFIIVSTQIPHQLGASIHSNAYTKIMLSLANGLDIDMMANSMGIKDKDQLQYCHKLGQREAVIKFSGRYQEPFLGYIPEIDMFNDNITDEDISQNNARILAAIPLLQPPEQTRTVSEPETIHDGEQLSQEETAFLWDVQNRPYISVTERYRTIDMGG